MSLPVYWGYSSSSSPNAAAVVALEGSKQYFPYVGSYLLPGLPANRYAVIAVPDISGVGTAVFEGGVFGGFNKTQVNLTISGALIGYSVFTSQATRSETRQITVATRRFAVIPTEWNPLDAVTEGSTTPVLTYSNNNKTLNCGTGNAGVYLRATGAGKSTGKLYFEITSVLVGSGSFQILGAASKNFTVQSSARGGMEVEQSGDGGRLRYATVVDGPLSGTYGPAISNPSNGRTYGYAFDLDASKVWVSDNGVYVISGNPALGTNPSVLIPAGAVLLPWAWIHSVNTITGRFLPGDMVYPIPAGFSAWDS